MCGSFFDANGMNFVESWEKVLIVYINDISDTNFNWFA